MNHTSNYKLLLTGLQAQQILEAIAIATKTPSLPMDGVLALALLHKGLIGQLESPAALVQPEPQPELALQP